jgi:hypothetical protein
MAEHYPKGTTECEAWCWKCRRLTAHRVDHPIAGEKGGGRRGPCIDPEHPVKEFTAEQVKRRKRAEEEKKSPRLFE